ncbi:MAG: MBL fold metallo-hydrolase [Pirellulaceae bacterium]
MKLRVSNAYLILADRPILVDTGSPGECETIRSTLRALNVAFGDLSLIVHTHVHSDHMGNTAEIATAAKCSIAYHHADQPIVDRSHNGRLNGVGLRGQVMSRFFSNAEFESVTSDIDLQDGMSLNAFCANVAVIETPGHTPGSISIVTPDGDAIIGDIIMGGYMGGNVLRKKPNYHYFADNIDQSMESLDLVLSRTNRLLYVGHGGPLEHTSVHAWRRKRMGKSK